jgi:hypothetical protein
MKFQRNPFLGMSPLLFILASLLLSSCASSPPAEISGQPKVDYDLLLNLPEKNISYNAAVRPILNRRCVVCHGCYDAPCQLKLSSFEGIQRGASDIKVYDGSRFKAIEPTRLGIDAKTVQQWREKGFHPVLNEKDEKDKVSNLENSVIYQMLRLKQLHPQPRVGLIPDDVDVGLDRKQVCTNEENFAEFAKKHPMWGMPYAMPNLRNEEYDLLVKWLAQGAQGPEKAKPSAEARPQIERWEQFLNGRELKQQLSSRYIYEHLVLAHIHLAGTSDREFYRLVRSRTPPGQPVDEIATVRPYDDPGPKFYYRLLLYQPSIVVKDHIVYEWSDQRMQRYMELFLAPEYAINRLPSYETDIASNPFKAFEDIPPISRYQFLLDDAHFFIEGFIKGPVCRGQIALDVIQDQFWVFFMKPRPNAITLQPEFLNAAQNYLDLPAQSGDNDLKIYRTWRKYLDLQREYMASKDAFLEGKFNDHRDVLDINTAVDFIWDGDGTNPNAALTVFRHFDSASVSFGLVGNYPKTAWVLDYPTLERIHYLLVAGFNVYGNLTHQLITRLYMDFLRMEAENQFLLFMPVSKREQIRNSWYQGMEKRVEKDFKTSQKVTMIVDTVEGYKTDNPKREFYQLLEKHLGKMAGAPDEINRCEGKDCFKGESKTVRHIDEAMQKMLQVRGKRLIIVPDVSFIRIRNGKDPRSDLAYALILNKGYSNITSMFENEDRRDRSQDTITITKGLTGSYPNFFFELDASDVDAFAEHFASITDRKGYEDFVGLYGMRRTNDTFWGLSDWFQEWALDHRPLQAGIYDLNRYRNR